MAFEFKFPDVGEGIHEGEIVRWRVKKGDEVKEDDILCEMETAKAIVEIPTPKSGTVLHLEGEEGSIIKVGSILAVIGEKGEEWVAGKSEAEDAAKKKEAPGIVGSFSSEPAVGLPSRSAESTTQKTPAPLGGIMGAARKEAPTIQTSPTQTAHSTPDISGPVDREPLKGIRKAIADHMSESMRTIPHVTHMEEFDATHLVGLRTTQKDDAEKQGIKLTYLAYFIEAAAQTLLKYPKLNASIDEAASEIIYKKYYNIGIAVDTPDGLMVPTIRDANKKDVFELARDIIDLANRARERKLKPEEFKGASFTITNIGSLGGTYATPIIPVGQAANLGIMRMREAAVVIDGKVEVRPIMTLVLSYDHRIVDGADAARFMNDLIKALQN